MGELVDRDLEHLRLLKIGYYVMAGITAFSSLFALLFVALGGMFASGAVPREAAGPDPRAMGAVFLGIALVMLVLGVVFTLLTWYTGRSLQEHRHRVFCMVMAVLLLLNIPWGTLLGVGTIMVLSRPSVKTLFEPQA